MRPNLLGGHFNGGIIVISVFTTIGYYYHPVVILANFNFFILKLHQRNVYNHHLLLFLTSEGKDVNKCIVVDNDSLRLLNAEADCTDLRKLITCN